MIALLLSASTVTLASTLSPPSNSLHRESDTRDLPSASETEDERGDEYAAHPVTIEARLGFGTPTGEFGGAISYSPIPALGVDCGAGANSQGLQLACGLRGRLVLGKRAPKNEGALALTLTSGFSTGPYVDKHGFVKITGADGPGPADRVYQRAYWWNTDIGIEERYETLVLRVYSGVGKLMNPDAGVDQVMGNERIDPVSTSLVYFGIGVGFAP